MTTKTTSPELHCNPFALRQSLALALIAIASISSARADTPPQITLGLPTLAGNACDGNSASATLNSDGTALSVLYSDFVATAGGTTQLRMDRKTCIMDLPITLPDGYSAAVVSVDYRGFLALANRAQGQFTVDYTYGGRTGPRFLRRYIGPRQEDLSLTEKLRASDVTWSGCGGKTSLHLATSMIVTTNGQNEQSSSGLDSADLKGGVVYEVQYKQCSGTGSLDPTRPAPAPIPANPNGPPLRPVGPNNPGPHYVPMPPVPRIAPPVGGPHRNPVPIAQPVH